MKKTTYTNRDALVALAEGKKLTYDKVQGYRFMDKYGRLVCDKGGSVYLLEDTEYYEYEPPKTKYLKSLEELLLEGFVLNKSITNDGMVFISDLNDALDRCYFPLDKLHELGKPSVIEGLPDWMFTYKEEGDE